MKVNNRKIPTPVIRAIGLFLLMGSMTYDEIIAWAAKFYPHLKLTYNDIAEIENRIRNKGKTE